MGVPPVCHGLGAGGGDPDAAVRAVLAVWPCGGGPFLYECFPAALGGGGPSSDGRPSKPLPFIRSMAGRLHGHEWLSYLPHLAGGLGGLPGGDLAGGPAVLQKVSAGRTTKSVKARGFGPVLFHFPPGKRFIGCKIAPKRKK